MIVVYIMIGAATGYFLALGVLGTEKETFQKEYSREEKILNLFENEDRVVNSDIQKLLGVADSTATKYLQELEDKGKIKQCGEAGRFVYYEKI